MTTEHSYKARVLRCQGGLYTLQALEAAGEALFAADPAAVYLRQQRAGLARPRGIFRKQSQRIMTGDYVSFEASEDPDVPWVISELHTRRNLMLRPPLANTDLLLVCFSAQKPLCDFLLLDKLLSYALLLDIQPLLVFTKADLVEEESLSTFIRDVQAYRQAGYLAWLSARDGSGLAVSEEEAGDEPPILEQQALMRRVVELAQGRQLALAGPSGVGKSSLMNALLEERYMETGGISQKLARGKHTTRHVELLPVGGCLVADTPGFSSFDLPYTEMEEAQLLLAYPEFRAAAEACRFPACSHSHEPDCAVRAAVEAQESLRPRYLRYLHILEEWRKAQRKRYR